MAPIGPDEKLALVRANRAQLDQDLMTGRLVFESMPRVVEFQLSNFCNMSCTMCYDGNNPPMLRIPDDIAIRIGAEVFPTASVLSPFVGSEPLIVTWDLARDFAQRYHLELDLITNVQFLDEAKFRELEPFVSTISFSIDSHMRDVYERIRLRSKPDKVFANLPVAARLCREHGIEPQANVVFMVQNAPFIDETIAFLADQGCTTVRLLAFLCPPGLSPDRDFSNALRHMSPEWVAWMMRRIEKVAQDKQIRVMFEGQERVTYDHQPDDIEFRPNGKSRLSPWEEIPYFLPGYCVQSADHVKVQADGSVYPCCVAEGDTLRLGNVNQQDFQQIWNGKEAQDLRRGMLTLDLPEICKSCSFHTAWFLPEQRTLPVVDWFYDVHDSTRARVPEEHWTLEVNDAQHLSRHQEPPLFRWEAPANPVDSYALVLGIGGTFHEENVVFQIGGAATEFRIPEVSWLELKPNVGMWWVLFGFDDANPARSVRSRMVRCVVRHVPIPRISGSTLYGN